MKLSFNFDRLFHAIVAFGLIVSFLGAQPQNTAAAPLAQSGGWLDMAWAERTAVTVTNPGPAVANYQVHVTLDTSFNFGAARPDGADLRVTAADDTTLLPFWLESWAPGVSASLFVRVPALGSGETTTLYLYYSNPVATSVSDGSSVFEFYDGFESFAIQPSALANASAPQTTPTYDGSGQVVHPGIVYFPSGWHGYEYWLAVEPYPYSNATYQNPSILASHDGVNWTVPYTLTNPIALPTTSYLADGDLFYDSASDQLWIYYIHQEVGGRTYLARKVSSDGISWGDPYTETVLFDVPDFGLISPAVVKVGSQYWMWSVNSGPNGCNSSVNQLEYRTSTDGVNWSTAQPANFSQPTFTPWGIDVIYVPSKGEFWGLVAAESAGTSCGNTALFFTRSSDGINWTTYDRAALDSGTGSAWDRGQIYRSTLLYDEANDLLRVWYSANDGGAWHQGYTERNYTQFLSALPASSTQWQVQVGVGSWSQSAAEFKRGAHSGQLFQDAGKNVHATKLQSVGTNFYQEWDMYDDLDQTAFKQVRVRSGDTRVGIGVWTGSPTAYYAYHDRYYNYTPTSVARSIGWHKFGILLGSDSSVVFYIDGQQVGSLTNQFGNATTVAVEGFSAGGTMTTTYYVDDIRIRKYSSPEPTATVGLTATRNVSSSSGWNLMGLSLQAAPTFTAQSFLDYINGPGSNCTEIDRWNNSGWESYHHVFGGTNFTVQPGQGYFVTCAAAMTWQLNGTPITTSLPLALQEGWNLLAVPHSTSSYQAQSLLLAIAAQGGSCSEIDRWNNAGWESYHSTLGGTNFDIVADEGYFVQCSAASTFTP